MTFCQYVTQLFFWKESNAEDQDDDFQKEDTKYCLCTQLQTTQL